MKHSFFIPYLLLWFLIGHLIWRAILMLFNRLQVRHPVILAAIIGIAAGFLPIDGAWLGLSRTLVYLPFFAFGYVFRDDAIQRFSASRFRKLAAGLSVGLLIVLLLWPNVLHPEWLMNHMTFRELDGWSNPHGMPSGCACSYTRWRLSHRSHSWPGCLSIPVGLPDWGGERCTCSCSMALLSGC